MVVYNNEDGGNSFFYRCNRQESITSLCLSIRDQHGELIPNFPDSHIILQFSKRLRYDKYGSILEKILDYIEKMALIISYYFIT
jgi:hypothetical protein